jgi:hypothetical protein|tara:strand:+ start:24 stop:311 length:288 start_codon:yes stop_codon:yes gene_type:complete
VWKDELKKFEQKERFPQPRLNLSGSAKAFSAISDLIELLKELKNKMYALQGTKEIYMARYMAKDIMDIMAQYNSKKKDVNEFIDSINTALQEEAP